MSVEVVFDRSQEALSRIETSVALAVSVAAEDLKLKIQHKVLDPPKTGEIYYSKNKPSPHQASAPGEAPANWTGQLVSAVETEDAGPMQHIVQVNHDRAPYGADYLEHGSPGGKIAPRPFFWPSVKEMARELPRRVRAAIVRVLR